MRSLFSAFALFFVLYASLSAQASPPTGVEHIRTLQGIEEYRLKSNGLRILLLPKEGLPVATVMVTYGVGSRNESVGTTGATHILEHMMFKGTEEHPTEEGSDYSSQMERIGARSNATTYFDRTNYYATLPSEYVPLAIELEADRMTNLRLREADLKAEMTVVRNEFERGENNPVRTLVKETFATAFIAHPYNTPVIGWKSDIESITTGKLRAFYDTYYWPRNATLSVIGSFEREDVLAEVVDHYGSIPTAPEPIPEIVTEEPEQLGPRRLTVERNGQVGVVLIGQKVPPGTHQDWAALTLLDQVLTADKNGRFYRALEDKGKASGSFAFGPQLRDPGLFMLGAYLTPESTHEEVESIMLGEIREVAEHGVTAEELERAKSVLRASRIYGRDGPFAIADALNEAIAMGDWTTYVKRPEQIQNVTAKEVQRVAETYFTPRTRTTGWFVPTAEGTQASLSGSPYGPQYYREPGSVTTNAPAEPEVNFSKQMEKAEIGKIEIVAIDMPVDGMVSFVGSFAAGEALAPIEAPTLAGLTAAMLDKGTERRDRFEIAARLDALGADIQFGADAHSLGFSGKFLRTDAGRVLALLAEQLRQPAFDPEVFETVKTRSLSGLLQAVDNPDYRAEAALARQLYKPGHPNFTAPIKALIEETKATTIEDLRRFHERFYGPKSMRLVFAGDIDFQQLTAAVESAFDGWSGGVDYPEPAVGSTDNPALTEEVPIADKTSISVRFGQTTGLQRNEPDYLPFMVGNYILGGTFNARLMSEIRKERGLTYNIRSYHTGDILTEGHWALTASFSPSLLDAGLAATGELLKRWHADGVEEEEVDAARQTLSGSYLVNLSTTAAVARQTLSFMHRGFDPEYIDQYPRDLRGITAEAVNKAIQTYFDPGAITRVMAGSFNRTNTSADAQTRKLEVRLDAPDPAWNVGIQTIHHTEATLIAISRLEREDTAANQVITTVSDAVQLPLPEGSADLPVRHYILGKTWDWGSHPENYRFIDSLEALDNALAGAKTIYEAE